MFANALFHFIKFADASNRVDALKKRKSETNASLFVYTRTCVIFGLTTYNIKDLSPFHIGRDIKLRIKIAQRDFTLYRSHEAFIYA